MNEQTQHTPGPWVAQHSGTGDATVIADNGWKNKDGTPFRPTIVARTNWPDARLIASAPSLLAENARLREALGACIEIMSEAFPNGLPIQQGTLCEEQAWDMALHQGRLALSGGDPGTKRNLFAPRAALVAGNESGVEA